MKTPQWVKKLGGHAGELYVAAELSKRGIPNSLLPENFSDDDILIGKKDGSKVGYIQVKSCHPDRANSFLLRQTHEQWIDAPNNQYVILVWLGSARSNGKPRYWVALKREVGQACMNLPSHGTDNWERRFLARHLNPEWEDRWGLFSDYMPE